MGDRNQFKILPIHNTKQMQIEETIVDRLEMTVIELQNLQSNNTEQTDRLTNAIGTLEKTIKDLDKKNSRQQLFNTIIGFIAALFTVASVIQVIDILVRGIGK